MTRSSRRCNERPSFQFNNLLDLVRDQPYQQGGVNYDPITGQVASGAFGTCSTRWGLRPGRLEGASNLTLTLGVRWDDYGDPYPDNNTTMGNIFLESGGTLDERFANAAVRRVDAVSRTA